MVEVARRYAVDGLHFDYIRYPDGEHCYCAGCRERFEGTAGAPVAKWPADVHPSGLQRQRWLDSRRDNISTVVREVSRQARQVRPGLKLSAAVFRNWASDRDSVGQDWKLWCERGWLDFVCPMDYTPSDVQLGNWITSQLRGPARRRAIPGSPSSSTVGGCLSTTRSSRSSSPAATKPAASWCSTTATSTPTACCPC